MSDSNSPESPGAAEPEMRRAKRSILNRVSIVWLVPILALIVSLLVVWQNVNDRGPLIEVVFEDASGISTDETEVRYRDVAVGVVEALDFTEDLQQVVAQIRMDKEIAAYLDEDAEFWVVKPEVSARGVSGLDTVLSGVYIEASWDSDIGAPQSRFDGRPQAPLAPYGRDGVSFQLRGQSVEGLSEGTEIYYRGIAVGQIANLRLSEDGASVIADAFVQAPQSRLISTATRFWDTSGFTFSFGAQGAQLSVSSLASLVSGGISFDTPVSGGEPVAEDTVFRLFGDEETARSSVFSDSSDGEPVNLSIVFEESVPGLEQGADVDFGGIVVGSVTALTGLVDEARFGDRDIRLLTTIEIRPGKLGLEGGATEDDVYDFFDFAVARGLRAQLQSASILGGLQIALVETQSLTDAELDFDAEPYPQIPSIAPDLSDFTDTAQGVFNRINALPIEELLDNANSLMSSVTRLVNEDGVQETPDEILRILAAVRGLISSEGIQSIPNQANELMLTLNETATDLRGVVAELQAAGAVERLTEALAAAEEAADAVVVATADFPQLVQSADGVAQEVQSLVVSVNELPLDVAVNNVNDLIARIDTLIAGAEVQALPGEVNDTLAVLRDTLTQVEESGLLPQATQTLATAEGALTDLTADLQSALAEAERAAAAVTEATADLPQVLSTADTAAAEVAALERSVNEMPLGDVVANAESLVGRIDTLVAGAEVQALPGEVNDTLFVLRDTLAQVQESGLLEQATRTLATAETSVTDLTLQLQEVLTEAQRAATSVANATDQTPELIDRANRIAEDLETLSSEAATIPVQELSAQVSELVASANTLVSSDDTQRLPGALADALNEVQRVLITIQDGGLIENANQTMASAEQAADAIRRAADQLPALLTTTSRLLVQSGEVLQGYEANGQLGSQARATLREVQEAAQSIDSLARQIERSPNSLLFGR